MSKKITEALGKATKSGAGRVKFQIITPGTGSSGVYTEAMLQQAVQDRVFPEGTLSMVNHSTASEDFERPEGDLRNLAGVLLEDAYWDGNALVAEARIGSAWRDFVDEFGEYIGVSISAQAEVNESGEITRLLPDPFNRVDLVTVAGRGGEISEVLEAARVIESRSIVKETTESDIDMWLSSAVRDEIQGFAFVIDHDNEYVYYIADGTDGREHTYRRSYTLDGSKVTLDSNPVEVRRRTEYDPVQVSQPAPAGPPEIQPDQQEANMAQIDEKQLQELQEKARRSDELSAELEALKEAQATEAAKTRQARALEAVKTAFGDDAPALYVTAAETAAQSEDYDHEAFKAMVDEAAGHQAAEAGTPNLGGGTVPVTESESTITDDDIVAAIEGRA